MMITDDSNTGNTCPVDDDRRWLKDYGNTCPVDDDHRWFKQYGNTYHHLRELVTNIVYIQIKTSRQQLTTESES